MRLILTGILGLVLLSPAWSKKDHKRTINETMNDVGSTMQTLIPLMVSEESFHADQNHKKIERSLMKLRKLFREARPHLQGKSVNYKVSYQVMADHIDESLCRSFPSRIFVVTSSLLAVAVATNQHCLWNYQQLQLLLLLFLLLWTPNTSLLVLDQKAFRRNRTC